MTKQLKILNLYAGIGGNRKLWGDDHDITAVEIDPRIAKIYQDFFPKDKVIVADAHQFLLEHFSEYDFIWSSPPCPSHSKLRKTFSCSVGGGAKPVYPDMKLYEEILLLQGYYNGKYCIENVIGWYKPLISPQEIQRHYFWTNFWITPTEKIESDSINIGGRGEEDNEQIERLQNKFQFNLADYKIDKRLALRNCVQPELGLYIFQEAFREYKTLL